MNKFSYQCFFRQLGIKAQQANSNIITMEAQEKVWQFKWFNTFSNQNFQNLRDLQKAAAIIDIWQNSVHGKEVIIVNKERKSMYLFEDTWYWAGFRVLVKLWPHALWGNTLRRRRRWNYCKFKVLNRKKAVRTFQWKICILSLTN